MKVEQHSNQIIIHYPRRLVFGNGSVHTMVEDLIKGGKKRIYILTVDTVLSMLSIVIDDLKSDGIIVGVDTSIKQEPTFSDYEKMLNKAASFKANCIIGIGGGSVMDVAKVVSAFIYSGKNISSYIGNGLIESRDTHLICVPTTSGTGSEVSPNSILIDNEDGTKKGIISPCLVPDAAYIDPELIQNLPPDITAQTGMDALTHCIEAYANKHAHPMVDTLALDGIRLISRNLARAVKNGNDLEARSNVALGSVYGGMCLGPVNTAAVHALAYPLGAMYKVSHGLSNALLLPFVMEHNLPGNEARYSNIALAMGAKTGNSDSHTAKNGIDLIKRLMNECRLPSGLSHIGVSSDSLSSMASSAFDVKRLLNNNLKDLEVEDIYSIYNAALS